MTTCKGDAYIVDVGCSWSAARTLGLRKELDLPVLFIDPDEVALERVPANSGDIKESAAITNYDGEAWFHFYSDGTHSLLETNLNEVHKYVDGHTGKPARREDWTASRKVLVPCFRLQTLVAKYGIESIEFLKVDAQGHDLEVVKSLEDSMSIVKYYEVEVQVMDFELYQGSSRMQDVLDFADSNGFKLIASHSQTFEQERMLIFQNLKEPSSAAAIIKPERLLELLSRSESDPSSSVNRLIRRARGVIRRFT